MEKWVIAAKRADFNQIGQQFHIDPVIARLIRNRDVIGEDKIREYLSGTVQELPSPWLMKDMEKAVDILEKKISQKATSIGNAASRSKAVTYTSSGSYSNTLSKLVPSTVDERVGDKDKSSDTSSKTTEK